jgi:signal transduction histidine kinase
MAAKARSLQQSPESRALLEVSSTGDELTDLGQAFNHLLVTLRDTIERQQRFAGDASHQLRTPLAAMLTAVDVAARQERSPDEYRRILAVVQRRGRDLQQIVEILLALARRSPGSDALESKCVELNAWCRERVELWQAHPRSGDIELQLSSDDLLVQVQPTLLGQVMDNLLDNACKYSDAGSVITIRTQANAAEAIIRVEDRGPGIPASELAEIFEPFFRSANARQSGKPGSGLGLTLAQRLAAVFSGRVEVESTEGRGSSFQVVLPRVVEPHIPVSEPLQTSSSAQSS